MLGGSDDELRLVAVALLALTDRLAVAGRRQPPLLDVMRAHLRACGCLEETDQPDVTFSGDGDDMMAPLLLTRAEAAGLLRLSERSVARAVADGHLQVVRCGKAVRIRPADLEAFVAALAAPTTTGANGA